MYSKLQKSLTERIISILPNAVIEEAPTGFGWAPNNHFRAKVNRTMYMTELTKGKKNVKIIENTLNRKYQKASTAELEESWSGMKNIVLIGMPASGKSTIGVLLAKSMGMDFVDTDLLIQRSNNALLQDIITKEGVEKFIKIEEQVVMKLNCSNTIIATGGSVVYSEKAIKHLKINGIIIYLNVSYNEINRRLTNITSRGIVFGAGQDLLGLFNERVPLYRKNADMIIDCEDKEIEEIVTLTKDEAERIGI